MTDKTIKQHLQEADSIVKTVTDANALVLKLQRQLQEARDVIELLGNWSHPKLNISPLYGSWAPRDTNSMTGLAVAKIMADRISALLGDRA